MRIALIQSGLVPRSVDEAVAAMAAAADEVARRGARLALFPELFLCGYGDAGRAAELALTRERASETIGAIAQAAGVAICAGYAERAGQGLFNAAILADRDGGALLHYRKMHPWGAFEERTFLPGEAPVTAMLDDLSVGILVCFDLDMPVVAQDLARQGAELLLVPSATTEPYRIVPDAQVRTRAYDNAVFVAYCNRAADGGEERFLGASMVAAPDGAVVAASTSALDEIVVADIDRARYQEWRRDHRYFDQQRTDIYPVRPLPATPEDEH